MFTIMLDGYNVIHAVPELARQLDRSLESARAALVARCQAYPPLHGAEARLTVVFDGNRDEADVRAGQTHHEKVTVLYTLRGEEADDRILGLLRAGTGRDRFMVVSNDTPLLNNARALGARIMTPEEFYKQLRPARTVRSTSPAATDRMTLSARDAKQITEDYRKYLEDKTRNATPPKPSLSGPLPTLPSRC